MKRRSKLFLIVAAIIIGAGAAVCLAGYIVSHARGEQIFADKLDSGERGYTYYFKDEDLDILKLYVDDADINIIGGAESAKIEIINFNESLYSFDLSGAMVTFKQSPDMSSVSAFWEGGITFKGLRYFINPGTGRGKGCINVYVNSDEYIKVFDLSSTKGKITVSGIDYKSDYQLHPGSGGISLENISEASTVNITSTETGVCEIAVNGLSGENVNVTAPSAKLSAKGLRCNNLALQQSGGAADIDLTPAGDDVTVDIATVGKLCVNGENYIDRFEYAEKDTNASAPENDDDGEEKTVSSVKINTGVSSSDASVNLTLNAPLDSARIKSKN